MSPIPGRIGQGFDIVGLVVDPHRRNESRHEARLARQLPELPFFPADTVHLLADDGSFLHHDRLRIFRAERVEGKRLSGLQRDRIGLAPDGLWAERAQAGQMEALRLAATGDHHVVAFAHAFRFDNRPGIAHIVVAEHATVGVFRDLGRLDDLEIGPEPFHQEFFLVDRQVLRAGRSFGLGRYRAAVTARPPFHHDDNPLFENELRRVALAGSNGGCRFLGRNPRRRQKPRERRQTKRTAASALVRVGRVREEVEVHRERNSWREKEQK